LSSHQFNYYGRPFWIDIEDRNIEQCFLHSFLYLTRFLWYLPFDILDILPCDAALTAVEVWLKAPVKSEANNSNFAPIGANIINAPKSRGGQAEKFVTLPRRC